MPQLKLPAQGLTDGCLYPLSLRSLIPCACLVPPRQLLATPLPKIYETDAAAAEALMHPTVATIAGENFSAEAVNKARPAGLGASRLLPAPCASRVQPADWSCRVARGG